MVGPLKKLFGKKSEYAIEIDEAKSDGSVATEPSPAAPAKPEAPKAEAPVAKAEPAKAPKAKSAKAPKAKSAKAPKAKPAPEPTPVAAASAPAGPAKTAPKAPEPETGFATRYLMPLGNNTRRRPGPNMQSFLDMARTAKK